MRQRTASKKQTNLVLLEKLEDTDICCGRGKGFINHPGNQKFQETIHANLESYAEATSKNGKSQVVASIVLSLCNAGARFVKKDSSSGKWHKISLTQAHEKTGHAIRDHILNKSKRQAKLAIQKSKAARNLARSKNFLLHTVFHHTAEIKSSLPNLINAAPAKVPGVLQEDDVALRVQDNQQQAAPDLISSCCSDLQQSKSYMNTIPTPLLAIQLSSAGEAYKGCGNKCQQIDDMIDWFAQEENPLNATVATTATTMCHKSAHCDFSRQEVLEICSLLSVYEQPEQEESNSACLPTIFPSDWL